MHTQFMTRMGSLSRDSCLPSDSLVEKKGLDGIVYEALITTAHQNSLRHQDE